MDVNAFDDHTFLPCVNCEESNRQCRWDNNEITTLDPSSTNNVVIPLRQRYVVQLADIPRQQALARRELDRLERTLPFSFQRTLLTLPLVLSQSLHVHIKTLTGTI